MIVKKMGKKFEFYTHVVATTPQDRSSRLSEFGTTVLRYYGTTIMRSASFWGFFTSCRRSSGRRSDLLKVPVYIDPDSEAVREGLL